MNRKSDRSIPQPMMPSGILAAWGQAYLTIILCASVLVLSCTEGDDDAISAVKPAQPIGSPQVPLLEEDMATRLAERVASFPSCPVTDPNGSVPPGVLPPTPSIHGNGELWVALWPDGVVYFVPNGSGSLEADGSLAMKFPWWRKNPGDPILFEGRRLDGPALPLRSHVPEGYDGYFQASSMIFAAEGCWQVTAKTASGSLTIVTLVVKLN